MRLNDRSVSKVKSPLVIPIIIAVGLITWVVGVTITLFTENATIENIGMLLLISSVYLLISWYLIEIFKSGHRRRKED